MPRNPWSFWAWKIMPRYPLGFLGMIYPCQCNMHISHPCALAIVVNAHGATHVHSPLAMWGDYHFTVEFVFIVIFVVIYMMFSTLLFDFVFVVVFVVIFVVVAVLIYPFYICCRI